MTIEASFTSDVTTGQIPLTVSFTDTSTGNPNAWMWNFGDGFTSPEQNPTHIYTSFGFYTVSLVVYFSTGNQNVIGSLDTKFRKFGFDQGSYEAAYNEFALEPFTINSNTGIEYGARFLSPQAGFQVRAGKADWNFDLSAFSSTLHQLIFNCSYLSLGIFDSFAVTNGVVFPRTILPDTLDLLDVTSFAGSTFVANFQDGNNLAMLPQPPVFNFRGWVIGSALVVAHTISARGTITVPDYIQAGENWCGMGWIMLSTEIVDISPSEQFLVVTTDKPVHLFGTYTIEKPNKNVIWREKYGAPYRCYPHYQFSSNGIIEQLEASDTIDHTFAIHDMASSPTLNIIFFGTQCGVEAASSSPLLQINSVLA